jgi:hypothetical protein
MLNKSGGFAPMAPVLDFELKELMSIIILDHGGLIDMD